MGQCRQPSHPHLEKHQVGLVQHSWGHVHLGSDMCDTRGTEQGQVWQQQRLLSSLCRAAQSPTDTELTPQGCNSQCHLAPLETLAMDTKESC